MLVLVVRVSAHRVEILRARHQRSSVRWLHLGQVGGLHSHLEQSVMSQLADQGADVIDNGVGDQVGGQGVCGMGQTDEVFHLGEVESFGGGAAGGVHGLVLSGSPGRRWV